MYNVFLFHSQNVYGADTMKNVHKILSVVFFFIIIFLVLAFSSIYPFTAVGYIWQCTLCGFFGLLWIICLLIEVWKKDAGS
jgi:hypothetical protein